VFNRPDLIQKYPWLSQRDRRMIIGNDLDALLSAQFLHHTLGWSIAGFYNYTTLYIDPAIAARECVWVDLDIYDPTCCSIGHHILRPTPADRITDHRSSVNPNLLRGIDQTDFTHKYPLGTIHFLLWLHDARVRNKRACTLLLWLADSTWINAQRYRSNVGDWLNNWIGVPELSETFEQTATADFEAEMQAQVLSKLQLAELEPGNVQNVSRHLGLGGHQCAWDKPDDLSQVRRVTDLIYRNFGWRAPQFPREFKAVEGKRHAARLSEVMQRHGSFDQFLAHEKVFSYVIPNRDRVNYTTGIVMRNESFVTAGCGQGG
jgi:hypothetical protein